MSEKTVQHVTFCIGGDFITTTARDWYYKEDKPYEKVEELLLSCMLGTEKTEDELKRMARGVLLGDYKFTGNSRDKNLTIVEDGSFNGFVEMYNKMEYLRKRTEDNLVNLYDCTNDDEEEDEPISCSYTSFSSGLLDDCFKAIKYDDNYGWLKPDGQFFPVDTDHLGYAEQVIADYEWEEEFNQWWHDNIHFSKGNGYQGDFLVYVKGWVLVHNPARGIGFPEFNPEKGMTKAQKEFMFDYYIERNEHKKANDIYSEE